jgi:iron complex outermembrane recepter protein
VFSASNSTTKIGEKEVVITLRDYLSVTVAVCATALSFTAAQAQEEPGSEVDEVVVTAQRREERAQEVPIAITAVSGEGLRERGITNLQDMQASVPSLVIGPNGQASRDVMSPTIRGQSASFQGGPGVVIYMNEVPLPAGFTLSTQGGPGNFIDLQSVQVLSGAQGTLFGRNTTGGAILLTPAKPTDAFEGSLSGSFGNYNMTEFQAVANIPLSDKLRVRLVGASRDRDGFTYDVNWNKDRDDQHWRMARGGVDVDLTDTISNYTLAYYGRSHSNGSGQIIQNFNTANFQVLDTIQNPPNSGNFAFDFCRTAGNCSYYDNLKAEQQARGVRQTAHGVDDFTEIRSWGVTNTTDVQLATSLKLRNIVSYAELETSYAADQDGTIAPVYDTGLTKESREFPRDAFKLVTEELQLQGGALDDMLTYTIGGFYSKQSPNGKMAAYAINVCSSKEASGYFSCGFGARSRSELEITNESKAAYAQGTLDLGVLTPTLNRVRLTAGYRHTWDSVEGSNTSFSYITAPGGMDYTPGSLALCSWKGAAGGGLTTDPQTVCKFGAKLKSDAPNWTVGVDYRPNDDLMLYAKVTRGYKAGGFNAYAVFENTRTFGPEYVTDYELGFKSDYNIGGMPTRLNVNGFYLDYSHIQRASSDRNIGTGGNGAVTLSTASAVVRGVEVDAMIRPTDALELGLSYSYTDAYYKSFIFDSTSGIQDCTATSPASPRVFGGADVTCRDLQYLSPNIVSVYGRLNFPVDDKYGEVSLFVNYNWTDTQQTNALFEETFPNGAVWEPGIRLPSFGLLNATLDWRNAMQSGLDVSLFATNLLDELYVISNSGAFSSIGGQSRIFGEPRMFGMRLRRQFGV